MEGKGRNGSENPHPREHGVSVTARPRMCSVGAVNARRDLSGEAESRPRSERCSRQENTSRNMPSNALVYGARERERRGTVRRSRSAPAGDTRGKLLALLCSTDRTTSELARELGISANGVREQLIRLEVEGLVEHRLVRRGVGKPAHQYHLTAEGSLRLSRAYLPLLSGLLAALSERPGAGEEEALLRQAGRTLALQHPTPAGDLRQRVDAAVELLGELGGISTVEEETGDLCIHGLCCPLRALIPDHPLACKAVEAMLGEFIGAPVQEQCDKHDPPACRLVIGPLDAR